MELPRNNYLTIIYRMVKKIKVVELNTSNPEATAEPNVEQEAAPDPTPMQEPESVEPVAIPDSIPQAITGEEPKAKKPRQPRQPREPRPAREAREPRAPREQKLIREPPPSDSDSIDTEEMVAVIKNHRASKKQPVITKEEPPAALPPPVEQVQAKAVPQPKEEKATCPDCKKVISVKSLKYIHAKNCRAKAPTAPTAEQKHLLQRQKNANYQNEHQRLRGILEHTVVRGVDHQRLHHRTQDLKRMLHEGFCWHPLCL